MEQRSEEWFAARLGKVTASRIADVMATTKTGYGAARKNYMAELVCERLTGQQAERFSNAAMQWGTDTEPQARAVYSMISGQVVEEVGFIDHPTIDMSGASPDGLIGSDGLVEIKCPNTATHIDFLVTEKIADKHLKQMLWQLDCTGREWCDFMSFDPRLPDEMQLLVKRVYRDEDALKDIREEVQKLLGEVSATLTILHARFGKAA